MQDGVQQLSSAPDANSPQHVTLFSPLMTSAHCSTRKGSYAALTASPSSVRVSETSAPGESKPWVVCDRVSPRPSAKLPDWTRARFKESSLLFNKRLPPGGALHHPPFALLQLLLLMFHRCLGSCPFSSSETCFIRRPLYSSVTLLLPLFIFSLYSMELYLCLYS